MKMKKKNKQKKTTLNKPELETRKELKKNKESKTRELCKRIVLVFDVGGKDFLVGEQFVSFRS